MQKYAMLVDPSYAVFNDGLLFKDSDLNRDDMLRPYIRLKEELDARCVLIDTYDRWATKTSEFEKIDYYSFGLLENIEHLSTLDNVFMKGFFIFEPPVVAPELYAALPKLSEIFENIYLHNINGDGYSLLNVDQKRLKKLFVPQPYDHVLDQYWDRGDRQRKITVINGNKKPSSYLNELYSKRIEAMVALDKRGLVDLFGIGWERWWSRASMWWPYWKNRNKLMAIWKGSCSSKFKVFSNYDFCLCFENMIMEGYVTEKIFDCMYAGAVPIYWGAPDVGDYIPQGTFIDVRDFSSWDELANHIENMPSEEIERMRNEARLFLLSGGMKSFYNALNDSLIPSVSGEM